MPERVIYFGPPGTGKTTVLLSRLEQHLKEGVDPERIAFLTFTRRAKREALTRVGEVLGFSTSDLPHFRTIHSMAFKALKLKEGDVMGFEQLKTFGEAMGLTFGRSAVTELAAEGIDSADDGDAMLALDNLARLRGRTLKQAWSESGSRIDWPTVEHFSASYLKHKRETGVLDFTDVLTEFCRAGIILEVEVAFIDEAQDLSALQWLACLQACVKAKVQYIAGDDDQAIYRWAGASVKDFMELPGERRVLEHSYRLPRRVYNLARAVSSLIKVRVDKEFTPRDEIGRLVRHPSYESLPLPEKAESWLWLVRNRYLLAPLQHYLQQNGVVYSQHGYSSIHEKECDAIYDWEALRKGEAVEVPRLRDLYSLLTTKNQIAHGHKLLPGVSDEASLTMAELRSSHGLIAGTGSWFEILSKIPVGRRAYYRQLLRRHKSLKLKPAVQLETIHGAKGAEAEHVALFTEQSRRVWEEARRDPDDEARVWYVGLTRASQELHLVMPSGRWGYELPLPAKG